VFQQIVMDCGVGVDYFSDGIGVHGGSHMYGCGRDESPNVDLIRVEQQADQTLGVVRISFNVGKDNQSMQLAGLFRTGGSSGLGCANRRELQCQAETENYR